MEKITGNTIPEEIEILKPYAPYLMWAPQPPGEEPQYKTITEWTELFPTWPKESIISGLERLAMLAEKRKVLYDVYTPEEIAEDPEKEAVKIWFMPAEVQPSEKPFVLCFAGGGYSVVCSDVEGFPTAARLNRLGYNVFVPTYRVGLPDLMPRPLEDVAAILRFILSHKEEFGITCGEYVVNGFSAGGNLTCTWGLADLGYGKYRLPKPKALFPIYPVTTWEIFEPHAVDGLWKQMFGEHYDPETVKEYDIVKCLTEEYPPCCLVHAKDDATVPYRNSVLLKEALDERDIPVMLELAETGGHGFGDGRGTDAEGWIDRAVSFLEEL